MKNGAVRRFRALFIIDEVDVKLPVIRPSLLCCRDRSAGMLVELPGQQIGNIIPPDHAFFF